ncbi:MAG: hypothetical protein ACKOZU_01740 [Planctomycetaceae bacterium]
MSDRMFVNRAGATRRMRVVAVTGVAGKTTTAWLTAAVMSEAGLRVGIVSDLGCVAADGGLHAAPDRERPGAIPDWIARLEADGCTHAVVEVHPAALAAGALGRDSCAVVVVSGAARGPRSADHARRIAAAIAPGGCLVATGVPGLGGIASAVARRGGRTCLTAGLDAGCDVHARPVERSLHGQTFLASAAGQVVPVAVDVPVASYARNAMAAAAAGLCLGVPLDLAARGIEAAGGVAGRVERLDRGQEFAAFLDAPPCRHALASTLASLRRLTAGRLAVVAERRLVDAIGAAEFARPVRRTCDDVVVVPSDVLDDEAGGEAVAAYARVDRVLGRLGAGDCLIALGDSAGPRTGSGVPVATLVDGWLRLAHPPRRFATGPRAA